MKRDLQLSVCNSSTGAASIEERSSMEAHQGELSLASSSQVQSSNLSGDLFLQIKQLQEENKRLKTENATLKKESPTPSQDSLHIPADIKRVLTPVFSETQIKALMFKNSKIR